MRPTSLALLSSIVLFAVLGMQALPAFEGSIEPPLPVLGAAPSFELEDQQGAPFSSTTLAGRVWIANFFFASCPHVCPAINQEIAKIARQLPSDKVEIVSITVDPERDTPEALTRYAERFDGNGVAWHFLRGPLPTVQSLMQDGFRLASVDLPGGHTTRIVLVDRDGNIRGYYSGLEPPSLQELELDLQRLLAR